MAKNSATVLLRKIAAEVYEQVASDAGFTLDQVVEAVTMSPSIEHLGDQLVEAAAWAAVKYVDERRTARPEGGTLFDDLERVIALGDGKRKRKGACKQDEIAEHVRIVAENASRAMAAANAEQEEFNLLAPFFSTKASTVDRAVRRYRKATA